MTRLTAVFLLVLLAAASAAGRGMVVADSLTRRPLSNASLFDCRGRFMGVSRPGGRLPAVSAADWPVTLRFMGYREKVVASPGPDTVLMGAVATELPEVVVESRSRRCLHMLAYVREYSTLATYTDTVFLFREKMVDYMLPGGGVRKFRGWTRPRVLQSRSYYHFTDAAGLDSVGDRCAHHFSWSDWVGVPPAAAMPEALRAGTHATDTLRGKYSAAETWTRDGSRCSLDVDVLADTAGRRWVPDLARFFSEGVDFENFRLRLAYDNVAGDSVAPADLAACSYGVESNGRGRQMFMFNRRDEPFSVSTYAEVYMLDREFISLKEARKWDSHDFSSEHIGIIRPPSLQPPAPAVLALVGRVDSLDRDGVRLAAVPDRRLAGKFAGKGGFGFGRRALALLKELTGITLYKSHKNFRESWDRFSKDRHDKKSRGTKGRE